MSDTAATVSGATPPKAGASDYSKRNLAKVVDQRRQEKESAKAQTRTKIFPLDQQDKLAAELLARQGSEIPEPAADIEAIWNPTQMPPHIAAVATAPPWCEKLSEYKFLWFTAEDARAAVSGSNPYGYFIVNRNRFGNYAPHDAFDINGSISVHSCGVLHLLIGLKRHVYDVVYGIDGGKDRSASRPGIYGKASAEQLGAVTSPDRADGLVVIPEDGRLGVTRTALNEKAFLTVDPTTMDKPGGEIVGSDDRGDPVLVADEHYGVASQREEDLD